MSEFISLKEAIATVKEAYENDEMFDGYEYRLNELPSTEIILCRECKYGAIVDDGSMCYCSCYPRKARLEFCNAFLRTCGKEREQMRLIIEEDKIIIDGIEYVPVEKKGIEVGDTVRVKDPGRCYTSYWSWPGWKEAPIKYAIRYKYFGETPDLKENYVVRYIGDHENGNIKLAIIEDAPCRECYLMNVEGLEKVR